MKFNSIISTLALGTVFLFSCQKETDYDLPEPPVPGERLEFSIEEEDPETVETKSILTDASIETKRTGVTVGVYENGALVDKTYSTSFSGITFTLQSDKTYKLYALVNMGDVQSQLPASEASLASFVYTIPAYTGAGQSVNALGIPMAGSLEYQPGVTSVTAIPVKRRRKQKRGHSAWTRKRFRRSRSFIMAFRKRCPRRTRRRRSPSGTCGKARPRWTSWSAS